MARSERRRRGRVAVGVALALAAPLLLACNSILGLGDFQKGECAGARCSDDGGLVDQLVEGGADVALDVRLDVKGVEPVSWARWPMPNYLAAGPGLPPPSPPLATDTAANAVLDTVTKLVWRATLVPGDFTEAEAEPQCQALPDGPWRAPKRIELVTLLDYSRPTFVDRSKFTDLKNFRVWTTSEVRPFRPTDPDQPYWTVSFESGRVEPFAGSNSAKVLCVRAK